MRPPETPGEPLLIDWPCGLQREIRVFPKTIEVVGGVTNCGKTGFGLDLARRNLDRYPVLPATRLPMRKTKLITLSKLTNRYRIAMDEAWAHERPEVRNPDRRWYEQIPCRAEGFIYLYSEDPPTLGLYSTQVKRARAIVKQIPGLKAEWMDGEAVIYFSRKSWTRSLRWPGPKRRSRGGSSPPQRKPNW